MNEISIIEARNEAFLEYQNLIRWSIRKNMPLLSMLHIDIDDVSQELAISVLRAIEKYDPSRGASMKTFICNSLQYAVLALNRKQRSVSGRAAGVTVVPLVRRQGEDDDGTDMDIPVTVDFDSGLIEHDMLNRLTMPELTVLDMKLAGTTLKTERQRQHFDRLKRKVYKFYVYPERRAAR